jgi:hypothetical protein
LHSGQALTQLRRTPDNSAIMQSLDIYNPGMPDLQFVLFVSALCTSDLPTLNIPQPVRDELFERCWALVHTGPPPVSKRERVLDLRHGNELTLDACLEAIQSILGDAGITTITWDHPPSPPSRSSTPEAQPLIDRLQQLYPDAPDIVDPDGGHAG